jgi:hypothetical protein
MMTSIFLGENIQNIHILQKKTKALLDTGKEVGHEVNPEKRLWPLWPSLLQGS